MGEETKKFYLDQQVDVELIRLNAISSRVRILCATLPLVTLGTMIFSLILPGMQKGFPIVISYFDSVFFSTLFLFACILFSIIADILVKRGEIVFTELSDELQWRIDRNEETNSRQDLDRPSLSVRITLRNFLKSSDLPFYRGSNGLLVYLLVNISMWLGGVAIGMLTHSLR